MRVLDCWVSSYNAWVSHDPRVSTVLSVLLDSAELLCSEFRLLLSVSETCAGELEWPEDHILK
jgi:hypothetical protein